jgi:hypothetical protein
MSETLGTLLDGLRTGAWLGRRRVIAYGAILLVLELAGFAFLVAGTHGLIVPLEKPTTTDFVSFYAAGKLAAAGTPALAYDQAAHYAAEVAAREPGIQYQFFFYPPVFVLLCALVARLPYIVAFIFFEAATLIPCLLVARGVLQERGAAVFLALLAFPAVFWTLGLGQNAFLTATLFGGAMLLIDRRPASAGLLLGALCYKPHFGLLIPIALAAGGRWRAFATAAIAVVGLVMLSVALFGWETWRDCVLAFANSHATYESGRIDFSGMVSPFGAMRLLGGSAGAAYAVQGMATIAATLLVAWIWQQGLSLPLRAAALAAATLVAIPVVLIYDLALAGIAMAWLVRAARESGFLPWEKLALAAAFLVPVASRDIGLAWHLPLAPLIPLVLLVLVSLRALRERACRKAQNARLSLSPRLTFSAPRT